jgi:membrane protease YdiL (CAAX protease family)
LAAVASYRRGAGFSLVNASIEETIFGGVLQIAMESVSGPAVAVAVDATIVCMLLPGLR